MNYAEFIKTFTKEDYLSGNVNLHIHTTYSDGKADFCEIVAQAKNMKAIAITDHNTIQGYIDNPEFNVIPGVEFDVWYKYIFLHLLAYGIDVNAPCLQKFYAKNKSETELDILRILPKRNLKKLINAIHDAGGIAVLAHPACCWAISAEKFISDLVKLGLDGIEIYYPYPRWRKFLRFAPVEIYENIADKYNLIKTGGSDCHAKTL